MKKLLILIFMLGMISFGESVSQTVARIRKDYNETNNYKNYRVETEEFDMSEEKLLLKCIQVGEML